MRFRRPFSAGSGRAYFSTIAGRRLLWQGGVVVGAFVAGYLVTVFWLFPAPFFNQDQAVTRLLDLGVSEARQKLEGQGFRLRLGDQQPDPAAPRGTVIWQDPPPGTTLPPNSQVTLVLSDGPPDLPVPDLAGLPRPLAERVLRAAGFKTGTADSVAASADPGVVVQTRPPAGVGRPAGTAIDLVVSTGPAELTVPRVIGLPLATARERIEGNGLKVGNVSQRPVAGRSEDVVIEQSPSAGTRVPRQSAVTLTVIARES